ncbi:MAG TPA: ABC transporter ATP-binding protein [Pyrinomonadaceae bacterium]|nr:ABC transporter ATP-binding protein [Pyrinomonadaceae bacterium]
MSAAQNQQAEFPIQERPAVAPAILLNDLSKTYPVAFKKVRALFRRSAKTPVEALSHVSLSIKPGEIFGLIGRNGAGKTTLTKIIATLVQPTTGTVEVLGYDSVRQDERVRRLIGLATAEERSFYWRLNPIQNLMFFARLYGMAGSSARRRINELVELLELQEVAQRRFGELSTGNKQRLAVARALLAKPPVLLLDEPTRSLDPLAAARMRDLIQSLSQQVPPVTILFTSHNLAEVETLCARVAVISRGRIRGVDSPANLRSLTQNTEKIRITIRGTTALETRTVLLPLGIDHQVEEFGDRVIITLNRQPGDEALDWVLKTLHQNNAVVLDIETERATLLDLLTQYETEER